jgi:hypothetical protein
VKANEYARDARDQQHDQHRRRFGIGVAVQQFHRMVREHRTRCNQWSAQHVQPDRHVDETAIRFVLAAALGAGHHRQQLGAEDARQQQRDARRHSIGDLEQAGMRGIAEHVERQ